MTDTNVTQLKAVTGESEAEAMEKEVANVIASLEGESHPAKAIVDKILVMARENDVAHATASDDLKATEDQIADLEALRERQVIKKNRHAELGAFLIAMSGQADAMVKSTDKAEKAK